MLISELFCGKFNEVNDCSLLFPFFSGMMSKAEHSVHNEWFEWITKRQQPQLDLISKG